MITRQMTTKAINEIDDWTVGFPINASNEEINFEFYWQVDILDGNVTRDNYGVLVIQSPSTPPEHEHDEIHGFSNPNYNAAYGGKFHIV